MDRALRLALAKARAVAERHPGALVIGSDQVACAAEALLEKPGSAARCEAQLAALSGGSARFYTDCAVVSAERVRPAHPDTTVVNFVPRRMRSAVTWRAMRPDCAGALAPRARG